MKDKIFKAKNETGEFIAADSCLIIGGFLIGTNLVDSASAFGGILVALGLFLGIRVLGKFSSDLKCMKAQIDTAMEKLKQTNEEVQANTELLDNASNALENTRRDVILTKDELGRTRREVQEMLSQLKKTEDNLFGISGKNFAKSSRIKPLDDTVDKLTKDMDDVQRKLEDLKRGYR